MARLVLKFGGTSVKNPERIQAVAAKVKREVDLGHEVAVVVSAMAGVTNQLVDFCKAINPLYAPEEYDAVVASGEQVTSGLTAIALQTLGVKSRSYQGWQIPLRTDAVHSKARIAGIDGETLIARMKAGEVPVIAGFQGVADDGRVTTLGRGGSDTSAVAIAAAVKADRCDIYTDVDGVYTTDPRIVSKARKLGKVTYEEMLEMASLGAKVLQTRSVEMAMKYRVPVQVLSSYDETLGSELPGTMMVDEDQIVEQEVVSGIAYNRDEAKITLTGVPDKPGVAARVFGPLTAASVNVDMIVQNISADGKSTDMTFTVAKSEMARAMAALEAQKGALQYQELKADANVAKISIVGMGMRSHAGVAQRMFEALAEKGINIQVISTSEIKVSVLIAEEYTELAIRALHTAYGLDAA
jgi:aspartate kinase